MKPDWKIAQCQWEKDRPAGVDYMTPWITAATGYGNEYPFPTVEVAWIAVYGQAANGPVYELYYTARGDHGLDTNAGWGSRSADGLWFGGVAIQPFQLNEGEVASIVLSQPFGQDIAHAWSRGPHIVLPHGVDDVWLEAKVRLSGDARLQVGFDWYATSTGAESLAGQGATSPFISGLTCGSGWVVLASPRRGVPWKCDTLVNLASGQPGLPSQPVGNQGTTNWTFDFTINIAPQEALTVFRKGSAWEAIPVTPLGNSKYQATTSTFVASDVLVIEWTTNGQKHWACEMVSGSPKLWTQLTAVDPSGKTYTSKAVSYGSGCDVGLK